MKAQLIRLLLGLSLFKLMLAFGPMMSCGGGSTPPQVIVPAYNSVNLVKTNFLLDTVLISGAHDWHAVYGYEILIYDESESTMLACLGSRQSSVLGDLQPSLIDDINDSAHGAYVGLKDAFIASAGTVFDGNTTLKLKLVKKSKGTGYCQEYVTQTTEIIETAKDVIVDEISLTLNELIAEPLELGTVTIQVRVWRISSR